MRTLKLCFSYSLIVAGAGLLFLGARDLVESRAGQTKAAAEFSSTVPTAAPTPAPPAQPTPLTGDTFAQLILPRLEKQLFVVEGDGKRELRRGPGHLSGTAMPGAPGNCVIAGHRDTHFRVLKDVRNGDDIVLATAAGRFRYRVNSTRIVSPSDNSALQPTTNGELNLITCYPFYYVGSAPKRFVVRAELAGPADEIIGDTVSEIADAAPPKPKPVSIRPAAASSPARRARRANLAKTQRPSARSERTGSATRSKPSLWRKINWPWKKHRPHSSTSIGNTDGPS